MSRPRVLLFASALWSEDTKSTSRVYSVASTASSCIGNRAVDTCDWKDGNLVNDTSVLLSIFPEEEALYRYEDQSSQFPMSLHVRSPSSDSWMNTSVMPCKPFFSTVWMTCASASEASVSSVQREKRV